VQVVLSKLNKYYVDVEELHYVQKVILVHSRQPEITHTLHVKLIKFVHVSAYWSNFYNFLIVNKFFLK